MSFLKVERGWVSSENKDFRDPKNAFINLDNVTTVFEHHFCTDKHVYTVFFNEGDIRDSGLVIRSKELTDILNGKIVVHAVVKK